MSAQVEAQRVDLDWTVRAMRGFDEGGIQVLFSPTRQIELRLTLVHDEDVNEWVQLEPGVFDAVEIRIVTRETRDDVSTVVQWREDAQCSPTGLRERCWLALRTSLAPTGSIQPIAVLVPSATAEFPAGEYLIEVDFTSARSLLSGADSEQWRGRIRERGTAYLTIRPVSGPEDLRQRYTVEYGAAMAEGDFQRALELSTGRMDEFADEPEGYSGAGFALLEQGRFVEAAPMFERALAISQRRPAVGLLIDLAAAYVAMGQEARGLQALQRHALPGRAPEIMEAARARAARIQAR